MPGCEVLQVLWNLIITKLKRMSSNTLGDKLSTQSRLTYGFKRHKIPVMHHVHRPIIRTAQNRVLIGILQNRPLITQQHLKEIV